ncbi:MAG: hypothetical protein FJY97_18300 [candidate division Zixibacteria bacterium]|nr:hypothetical protein [candidate division Zixibacteria bacterium]
MASREYYTFTLDDSIKGIRRALTESGFGIDDFSVVEKQADFIVSMNGKTATVRLTGYRTARHPLARFGRPVSVVNVEFPDDWEALRAVIPLAFLRGGG